VGPFASDDDKTGERKRETEETKRLLYVALTRARDRLYLGTVLKDGRAVVGNGSLAKVLPEGFVQLFEMAGRGDPGTAWTVGARVFPLRVCPPPQDPPLRMPKPAQDEARAADFTPLGVDGPPIAMAVSEDGISFGRHVAEVATLADRLLGTLVHRMLQRGIDAAADVESLAMSARELALNSELDEVEDPDRAVREAAATFKALATRADVQQLLASGERVHEMPVSFRRDGRMLRGVIDCLILRPGPTGQPNAEVVVVELKTGRTRLGHQAQLDAYVDAARQLFPGAAVSGVLLYP
jgi:ATP-dependent helicase/nuclease subunit A